MRSARQEYRLQLLLSLLCTLLVALAAATMYDSGLLRRADALLYDLNIKWRGPRPLSGEIALVLMDEKSAALLGRQRERWSRRQLADALRNLCHAGAEVIGLDLVLAAPDADPSADAALAGAISACGNVVLARISSAEGMEVLPLPLFQEAMLGDGFIDLPPDGDDVLRRIRFFNAKPHSGGLQLVPAFALELARTFRGLTFAVDFSDRDTFRLGSPEEKRLNLPYPDLIVDFHGDFTAFSRLSLAQVVAGRFPAAAVAGKIVIIGSSLATQKDFFSTPFSRFRPLPDRYRERFGTLEEDVLKQKDLGVSCHAFAVQSILNGSYIKRIPTDQVLLMTLLAAVLGLVFYLPRLGPLPQGTLLAAGLAGVPCAALGLLWQDRLWLDTAPLMTAWSGQFLSGALLQRTFETRRTAMVTRLFGQYVSPSVVRELIRGGIAPVLEGRRMELSVLFCDLRDFTTLSERLGARDTSRLLNTYFDALIPTIFHHQGTLDKLIGDAIMAFFGAPLPLPDHALRAAEASLDMLAAIERLRRAGSPPGIETLRAGVGINSGEVTVGNLGSSQFMDYTIIGDAVNLASRLEGLCKFYGCSIIVSEVTAAQFDGRFVLRELDRVTVKGRSQAVTIFELVGRRADSNLPRIHLLAPFAQGLARFRAGRFDEASSCFREALRVDPQDGPSLLYLERCERFSRQPPAPGWDGVTVFDHK